MLSVALGCHSWTVHRLVAHSFWWCSPARLAGDRFSGMFSGNSLRPSVFWGVSLCLPSSRDTRGRARTLVVPAVCEAPQDPQSHSHFIPAVLASQQTGSLYFADEETGGLM